MTYVLAHAARGQQRRSVSCVMPTWNRQRDVIVAAASVIGQTDGVAELIIVDDGSSDGTWEELEALAARTERLSVRLVRQQNRGPAAARNAGVRIARGEFVAFLDSDDAWRPDKIARQLAVFEANPELVLVGCAADEVRFFGGRRLIGIGIGRLLIRNYLLTPGVVVRRDVLERVGGFREDMRHCEDYELWLRIATEFPCALLNEPLMSIGHGKPTFGHSGLSRDVWAMQRGELAAFRNWRVARPRRNTWYLLAVAVSWLRFGRRLAAAVVTRPWRSDASRGRAE
jgi:glycosyltransferase involved in cell wall biosynthesis